MNGISRIGFAQLALATMDLSEAVKGAELIMVTTQALAHLDLEGLKGYVLTGSRARKGQSSQSLR